MVTTVYRVGLNRSMFALEASAVALHFETPWFSEDWRERLSAQGFLLIHGLPLDGDNRSLCALGERLGSPSLRALAARLDEGGGVQRVQALGGAILDRFGKPLQSAGHTAFALHTDESFLEQPARFVLLHCWQAAPSGGVTLLADGLAIASNVDRVEWIAWTQLRLPYPCGERCSIDAAGSVRFNPAECATAELSPTQQRWLARFSYTSERLSFRLPMQAGDVLILDNHRMLHGREAFDATSGRLLKRLRIR